MHERVHPLARELTENDSFLAYEAHADELFDTTLGSQKTWLPVNRIARWLVPGAPVMLS